MEEKDPLGLKSVNFLHETLMQYEAGAMKNGFYVFSKWFCHGTYISAVGFTKQLSITSP